MAARLKIPCHPPSLPWAAQRADRVAQTHHDLAAGDVAGNPSSDHANEFDRDLMRVGRGTTLRAFGLDDDALAPKRRIELQHRVPITVATHVPPFRELDGAFAALGQSDGGIKFIWRIGRDDGVDLFNLPD